MKCGIDITTGDEPPRELFVEVRVLLDVGEIMLESGQVMLLKKDSILNMKRAEAEKLIQQGVLTIIS